MLIIDVYKITVSYYVLRKRSDETLSLLGGKWRFPRMKVRLCSEESPGAQKGTKKGSFKAAQGADKLCLLMSRKRLSG